MDPIEEQDFRRFRKSGDPEAMARVFDAVAPKLLLVAGHLTRDAAEAEDLVQTTFLQAIQDAERWDEARPLVPWLVGILSHRALDQRRRNRLRGMQGLEDVPDGMEALDPLELVSDKETREAIAGSVDQLEEPYREVLILRIAHGLEPTEIAHTLGRSPGTVRMQLKRGREKLERALPRGLHLPAFLLVDAGRGLAAVREVVLAKAGASVAAATTVSAVSAVGVWTLGGLTMKAVVATVGVFGLGVILWAMFGPRPEREIALRETQAGGEELERAAQPLAPSESLETAGIEAPAKRVAAAPAPGVSFGVRVTFEEDGSAAPNVGVYLRPLGGDVLGTEVRTDESGLARIEELARGHYSVDLDRWSSPPVKLDLSRERTIELVIPSGIDVEGLVVDPEGDPVPGADVFRMNLGHHDYLQWTAMADADGVFRLRDVAPGTGFVARAAGFQPSRSGVKGGTSVRGEMGQTANIRLVVGARGNVLKGRVVDERGNPQPHARIALAVEEDTREDGISRLNRNPERMKPADLEIFAIRADETGHFTTDELPAGNATYFARTVGQESRVAVGPLEVTEGAEHELEIVVGPGASVFGLVSDMDGRPMRGFTIQTEWKGSVELGAPEHDLGILLSGDSTVTDEDGTFQVFGLLPGEHDVEVVHPSGETMAREDPVLELGELFRWTPQVEVRSDLRVRVLGPDGNPLAGWGVGLGARRGSLRRYREDRGGGYVPNATDENGRHRFENVRPSAQIVSIHPPTPEKPSIPVPAWIQEGVYPGADEVVIEVATLPTGSIRGRVLDASGRVPRERGRENGVIRVFLRDFETGGGAELAEDGSFEIEYLPPGTYILQLPRADDLPRDTELGTFELAAGQELDVGLLTPREPAFLELELVGEDGRPVPDPEVTLRREDDDDWGGSRLGRDRDAPTGLLESGALKPGVYTLAVRADRQDAAPHREVIELAPGEHLRKTITVSLGKELTFELTLPPHPNEKRRVFGAPSARIDIELFDEEGNFILRERDHFKLFDVPGNRLRITRRLEPGAYRVRFEDHRDPPLSQPRPAAEIEVEVPTSGDPDILLVELR